MTNAETFFFFLNRKYLRLATDHEEVLAFILGQMVKDKLKAHSLRPAKQADQPLSNVDVPITELEKRVRLSLPLSFLSFAFPN